MVNNSKESLTMEELDASITLSQNIFYNSPSAIIIYEVRNKGLSGKDYIIKDVNPMSLEIENWKKEEVVGKPLSHVRPGVDDFGIIEVFHQVYITGETTRFPARVYKEETEYRWFENLIFKLPAGEVVAIYTDVTEKKIAEEALYAEKEKLKITLYSIGDGVITTDRHGRVEIMNNVAESLTGWKQAEAQGIRLEEVFDIFNEITGEPCKNPVELVLEHGNVVGLANHTVLKGRDGINRAINDSAAPIKNPKNEILGVVLVFRDVTEEKEKEHKIEYLSYRDSLTGLYNRTFFEEELKRLDVEDQLPLTLIMGDLDGLKLINDAFGHQVGDEALIKIAEILKLSCRGTDVISRWGGDEFVVMLPKTTDEVGQKICNRIKEASHYIEVSDTRLSISLGCSTRQVMDEALTKTLKRAEDKMYKSKLLGAQSYRSVVLTSIKNTLFEKSCETEEHGERLGEYCREIGQVMGMSSYETDELQVLAMLHDIGKIAIEDQILKKPASLTEEEMNVMKTHPEIGFRIAQTVPELVNIADYILAHHERWDGGGYPRGLSGNNIPLQSRILAVADAYDAMTQDRPYRKALSKAYAKGEIIKNSGSQFDPKIVEIFLDYLKNHEDVPYGK